MAVNLGGSEISWRETGAESQHPSTFRWGRLVDFFLGGAVSVEYRHLRSTWHGKDIFLNVESDEIGWVNEYYDTPEIVGGFYRLDFAFSFLLLQWTESKINMNAWLRNGWMNGNLYHPFNWGYAYDDGVGLQLQGGQGKDVSLGQDSVIWLGDQLDAVGPSSMRKQEHDDDKKICNIHVHVTVHVDILCFPTWS